MVLEFSRSSTGLNHHPNVTLLASQFRRAVVHPVPEDRGLSEEQPGRGGVQHQRPRAPRPADDQVQVPGSRGLHRRRSGPLLQPGELCCCVVFCAYGMLVVKPELEVWQLYISAK